MSVGPDHSLNLPRIFARCGMCGSKGVFWIRPLGKHPGGIKCKYCGAEKRWYGTSDTLEEEAKLIAYGGIG